MEKKKNITVRILGDGFMVKKNIYFDMSPKVMFNMFLPNKYNYTIVNPHEKADICICGIRLNDKNALRSDELNILVSVEDAPHWKNYPHYMKYGEYGNELIDIYFYGFVGDAIITDKYITIPTVYPRIKYFMEKEESYKTHPDLQQPFTDKKFCLVTNRSNLNPKLPSIITELKMIGEVDHISKYNNQLFKKSCYDSIELFRVMNKYKFVVTIENSYNDAYITEKLFNSYFSNTIPIYEGTETIEEYCNVSSMVTINEIDKIKHLNESEIDYNNVLNTDKIQKPYINNEYEDLISDLIEKQIDT